MKLLLKLLAGLLIFLVLGLGLAVGWVKFNEPNRVSVPDWHATILHLLGLDHEQLVFERNGLEERLTGVFEPRVVREILA